MAGAKLISTSSFLPMHLLSALQMSGEDGIEVDFDEPRAPPASPQLPSSILALYESQYQSASTNGGVARRGPSSCPLKTTPP